MVVISYGDASRTRNTETHYGHTRDEIRVYGRKVPGATESRSDGAEEVLGGTFVGVPGGTLADVPRVTFARFFGGTFADVPGGTFAHCDAVATAVATSRAEPSRANVGNGDGGDDSLSPWQCSIFTGIIPVFVFFLILLALVWYSGMKVVWHLNRPLRSLFDSFGTGMV